MEILNYSWWAEAKDKLITLANQYPVRVDVVYSIWKDNELDFEKTKTELQSIIQKGY